MPHLLGARTSFQCLSRLVGLSRGSSKGTVISGDTTKESPWVSVVRPEELLIEE